jgi:hypothetical protein
LPDFPAGLSMLFFTILSFRFKNIVTGRTGGSQFSRKTPLPNFITNARPREIRPKSRQGHSFFRLATVSY